MDRPHGHRREILSEGERAVPVHRILVGPAPVRGEPSNWTLPDLCRFIDEWSGRTLCLQSMSRIVRRPGPSTQKTRPVHPKRNVRAEDAFAEGSFTPPLWPRARSNPARRSRSGSWTGGSWTRRAWVTQGRTGHRWGMRGQGVRFVRQALERVRSKARRYDSPVLNPVERIWLPRAQRRPLASALGRR